jgi:alpha-beta hydrolase superfamily lysophospholipase
MIEKTFEFEGKQDVQIFVRKWMPETGEIKGILQISHGMQEHSGRYTEFGEFLTKQGYIVYINDHRGHGKTAKKPEDIGILAEKDGWNLVVDDLHKLSKIIKEAYPNSPLFLFGHSFGSFTARTYITRFKDILSGVIISGTNGKSGALVALGKSIASFQGFVKGKTAKTKLLTGMSFKGFNDSFKPTKTPFDWLSKDNARNQNYWDDPLCGVMFSNRFFYDMFSMICYVNSKVAKNNVPTDLPMYIFSGEMDPVGEFGKEVKLVYNNYKELGVKDINLKLYEGGRHEMLNETNRQEVFEDIFNWLEAHKK